HYEELHQVLSDYVMAACPVDFPQSNLLCPLYGARGGKGNVVGPGNKQNDSCQDRKVVDQAHVSGERHWHRPIAEAKPVKMKVSKRNQVNFLFKVVLTLYPRQGFGASPVDLHFDIPGIDSATQLNECGIDRMYPYFVNRSLVRPLSVNRLHRE